jgi:type IV pilus assembly protein PilN
MIRVNLLTTGPGAAPPREWLPKEQRAAAFGALLLVVTAAGLGGWWWYLKSQKAGAEVRIDESQAKLDQLKEAVKLVDLAAARKSELTERLGLIDRLRDAKRQPVSLLETVSRSVPEGLWLTSIQQKGGFVTVDGRAMSLTAVTDFAETMQTSGLFKMPVEILSTTTEVVEEMDLVKFAVKAEPLKPAAPVTAPATGTTPVPAKSGV